MIYSHSDVLRAVGSALDHGDARIGWLSTINVRIENSSSPTMEWQHVRIEVKFYEGSGSVPRENTIKFRVGRRDPYQPSKIVCGNLEFESLEALTKAWGEGMLSFIPEMSGTKLLGFRCSSVVTEQHNTCFLRGFCLLSEFCSLLPKNRFQWSK